MSGRAPDPYASRTGAPAAIRARQDPVVHGTGPGPLDAAQLEAYRREGYLQLSGVLSAEEVSRLEGAVRELCASEAMRARPETVLEPDSDDVVRSIFQFHAFSEPLGALLRDPRIVGLAEQILGGPVYIHQSRINFKPAFSGKEFFWHSDFETWHVEDGMPRMRALSISLNLTDNNEFNGPLMVMPGSHHHYVSCEGLTPEAHYKESLRRQHYGTPDRALLRRLASECGIVAPKGKKGSLVIFDSNMMHGSGSNISPYPRCNLFVVYNSVENALVSPYSGLAPRPEYIANRSFAPCGARR